MFAKLAVLCYAVLCMLYYLVDEVEKNAADFDRLFWCNDRKSLLLSIFGLTFCSCCCCCSDVVLCSGVVLRTPVQEVRGVHALCHLCLWMCVCVWVFRVQVPKVGS